MTGYDLTKLGYLRTACVAPELKVADVQFNADIVKKELIHLGKSGVSLALFPELCLTGYTCGDLFFHEVLLSQALLKARDIALVTAGLNVTVVIGLPLQKNGRLYNCAAVASGGKIVGIVPKTYLPNSNEFYEERWFTSGWTVRGQDMSITIDGQQIPFGVDLLFAMPMTKGCIFGIEICEDLWAINPPSGNHVLAGATLILNPSASNELLGKADYRRQLVRNQSARCLAGYLYASAGPGESSTDTLYSMVENGTVLAESKRFDFETQVISADFDIEQLTHERMHNACYSAAFSAPPPYRVVSAPGKPELALRLSTVNRHVSQTPFVPTDTLRRAERCREVFMIQSTALAKRLRHIQTNKIIIGLSGGLDSTLAFLVSLRALEKSGGGASDLMCVTMPGFGTTQRTKGNVETLALLFGVKLVTIPIHDAVGQHFNDICHDPLTLDATYENAQARERTQILMDLANKSCGIVVGTGDLSEAALGWCTYNGDHMSMYHVNSGVPKTLVRHLIEWCAEELYTGEISTVLKDICASPISPELLPSGNDGVQVQETETILGPYILHDFFIFYMLRYKFRPIKILFLAEQSFSDMFSRDEIKKWLEVFCRRFFSQQFKRSATPDGPKVGSVGLSPRADLRMPSDAAPEIWLHELMNA